MDVLVLAFFLLKLCCLHDWLIAHNMTFYEHVKHKFENAIDLNPYNRNLFTAFIRNLCSKQYKGKIDLTKEREELNTQNNKDAYLIRQYAEQQENH